MPIALLVLPISAFSIGTTIATGLTVALVTGVPLGTWIGQAFGWRVTFLAVSGLGALAFLGMALGLTWLSGRLDRSPQALAAKAA